MKIRYTYIIYCTEPKSSYYGCIYYGQHTTNNLLDGYITSGKLITRYIKKYPNGYYRKILQLYNTEEELNKAEEQLIAPHLGQPYCLNLVGGGTCRSMPGHLNPMYGKKLKDYMTEEAYNEIHKKQGETLKETWSKKSPEQRKPTDLTRKHMSENHADVSGENNPMYGKNIKYYMTEEAYNEWKRKQSEAKKGPKNPMYGVKKHRVYHDDGTWHMEKI